MAEAFKVLMGLTAVGLAQMFRRATEERTRSNSAKLWHFRFRLNVHTNVLFYRVTGAWNSLSSEELSAESLSVFKTSIDKTKYQSARMQRTAEGVEWREHLSPWYYEIMDCLSNENRPLSFSHFSGNGASVAKQIGILENKTGGGGC